MFSRKIRLEGPLRSQLIQAPAQGRIILLETLLDKGLSSLHLKTSEDGDFTTSLSAWFQWKEQRLFGWFL